VRAKGGIESADVTGGTQARGAAHEPSSRPERQDGYIGEVVPGRRKAKGVSATSALGDSRQPRTQAGSDVPRVEGYGHMGGASDSDAANDRKSFVSLTNGLSVKERE